MTDSDDRHAEGSPFAGDDSLANTVCFLVCPGQMVLTSQTLPPTPPDGWARLRFVYCGVCGSDLSYFHGRRGPAYPLSLGHEFVAIVEQLGGGVQDLEVGDLVVSDLLYRCGDCVYCNSDRSHLCEEGGAGRFSNRAFAQRADIDSAYLFRLPNREPTPGMTLAEPLSCVLHALDQLDLHAASRIVVVGSGSIGSCMAFALTCEGVAFDVVEPNDAKRDRISRCLAPGTHAVPEGTGGYDLVLDASGSPGGMLAACRLLEPRGVLSSMSHIDGMEQDDRFLTMFSRKDATLVMSHRNGEPGNMRRAISLLGDYWADAWDNLISVHEGTEVERVFADRAESGANKDVVDCSIFGPRSNPAASR